MRMIALMLFIVSVFGMNISANAQSDDLIHTMRIGNGAIQSVEWSPAGDLILVNTVIGAWLYSPELVVQRHLPDAHLATFHPSGHQLVGVDEEGKIHLWDTHTWLPTLTLPETWARVDRIAWSPDGTKAVIAGDLSNRITLVLWKAEYPNTYFYLDQGSAVDKVQWSSHSRYLVFSDERGTFILNFDLIGGVEQFDYDAPDNAWWIGSTLVSVEAITENGTMRVQDVVTGRLLSERAVCPSQHGALSADGWQFAIECDDGVAIYDTEPESLALLRYIQMGDAVYNVRWSPQGTYLAFSDKTVGGTALSRLWIIDADQDEQPHQLTTLRNIVDIVWHPVGTSLLVWDETDILAIYDADDSALLATTDMHTTVSGILAWNTFAPILAIADTLGSVRLWNTEQGRMLTRLDGESSPVRQIEWQPRGVMLATRIGENDHCYYDMDRFSLWLMDGRILTSLPGYGCGTMAWSPNGVWLAVAARNQQLLMFDARGFMRSYTAEVNSGWQHVFVDIKWSPYSDGLMLWSSVCCQGALISHLLGETELHELSSFGPSTYPSEPPPFGTSDRFPSPTGRYMVRSAMDRIYRAGSEQTLFTFSDVQSLVWSPDDQWLALIRSDNQIWIADAETGVIRHRVPTRIIGDIPRPPAVAESNLPTVLWSPDSRSFAHVYGGVVDVWTLPE